ncbi:beta-glucosidase BglX [Blautia sp. OM06-15AC]|uniref:beta-glucosidase BglX n=1 Tax=Blautia sp. OM06-15AC TaxID=2292984 RepID=UPI000E4ED1CC|nr:beta-glucosidase BglX [Blautia sp. OM06-15AC]RHV13725.1 beta-glucosidase BglX [Blautia sp. OM06-15AC]
MTEQKLKELLADMTLEEKVNQMSQVVGAFFNKDMDITAMGPMADKGFTPENVALSGSILGSMGAETLKKIQKDFVEQHPHHIPMLFMLDVINGFKTIFPIPLGQGATFEPELSKKCAAVAAKEAAVSGLHVTFAPMTDLVRDARWGRVMESTGEDPYLNGLFCAGMVRGFQGDDLKEPYKIASCVKHFAGYGAPTAGRDYNTVELSEHTFRDFYLPSYKAGIDAGAAMVMTSFNTVNGVPATGNKKLMRGILRDEMGFDGVLISDWAAIEEIIYHGYCADREEAAVRSAEAGVDIDMMTGIYCENLCRLVREGKLSEDLIDESCMRILELKNKLGLFENPYKDADETKEKEVILCKEHRALAREAARKSFVLLKNEEKILPLGKEKKIAWVGPYVHSRNLMGSWSFIGDAKDVTNLEEAVKAQADTTNMSFHAGSPMLGSDIRLEGFGEAMEQSTTPEEEEAMLLEAVNAAKEADVVVLAIGEDRLQSGEATSNANIRIPEIQQRLLERVSKVNENVVVVLFNGRPLDLRDVVSKAKAVLEVWMPGTEGANAIADVVFGAYAPSGKLTMSFPYSVGQVPVHYNEYSTGRPHVPGKDKDRFRSKYLDIPNAPLFPFGYGLGYTSFAISDVKLDKAELGMEDEIKASVTVKNTGDTKGTETVQLYIHDVAASVVRPVKELKDFCKVTLQPGEETEVIFKITEEELRFLTENERVESENGAFEVFIGSDSTTENKAEFVLKK